MVKKVKNKTVFKFYFVKKYFCVKIIFVFLYLRSVLHDVKLESKKMKNQNKKNKFKIEAESK